VLNYSRGHREAGNYSSDTAQHRDPNRGHQTMRADSTNKRLAGGVKAEFEQQLACDLQQDFPNSGEEDFENRLDDRDPI
jgi:hypothetical protein